MTDLPASYHEDIQGRIRGILTTVAPQLPAATTGIVEEMISANECGVALEILSELLVESRAAISQKTLLDVKSLVDEMGLDPINFDRLRSRVQTE